MSRTPSANKNLVKAAEIKKAGFKTYIHSIVDAEGKPYYADAVRDLFLNQNLGAKAIKKKLRTMFPDVEPPSVTAIQNWCRRYAMVTVEVPAGTMDASRRPDALASMYKALEAVEGGLDKAIALQEKQKDIPLPMVRQAAITVVQVAEKIVQAEKANGMPPITMIGTQNVTNTQNNVTNAQQIIMTDPQKGKELLDAFKQFEEEVSTAQTEVASATAQ